VRERERERKLGNEGFGTFGDWTLEQFLGPESLIDELGFGFCVEILDYNIL
jgi:hypothetical protein